MPPLVLINPDRGDPVEPAGVIDQDTLALGQNMKQESQTSIQHEDAQAGFVFPLALGRMAEENEVAQALAAICRCRV